jgi:hypothetical protein
LVGAECRVDRTEECLQRSVLIGKFRFEFVLVAQRPFAADEVFAERDVNLVQDIVVELVIVGPDASFLERLDAERGRQILNAVRVASERVHVGRVRRRVECDQRGVHVARSQHGATAAGE